MTPQSHPDDTRTLIDELLAEQQRLTAVERFSRRHDSSSAPAQARYYRDLLPLTPPAPGEQYAFEVDLDKCTGCKACVSACHSLNGLDDGESWREVGQLLSDDWRRPRQQTVTTACHHCVDPGCLNGCPVLAYHKDPVTGIVRHLDDQCIGCQYCVMKCPYEVPRYSAERGIVRKCDMCANRLAVGEAPACVQACPTAAISITLVNRDALAKRYRPTPELDDSALDVNPFLPGSPDPEITIPSTRYTSSHPVPPDLLAGDHAQESPSDPHWPLVFMLVLSQWAVGLAALATARSMAPWAAPASFVVGALALAIGALHLGRPLKAWRAFLGWRQSWFSREVILFSLFIPLATLTAFATWRFPLSPATRLIALFAAATGLLAVACSAMLYVDTRRPFWSASQCFGKFFGTTLLLGIASAIAAGAIAGHPVSMFAGPVMILLCLAKLGVEQRVAHHWVDAESSRRTSLNKTARLLAGPLGFFSRLRVLCGLLGALGLSLIPLVFSESNFGAVVWMAGTGMGLCLLAEGMERYLFFAGVCVKGMPGKGAP